MRNVPNDWNRYYSTCGGCGTRTHPSDHYACLCDDHESYQDVFITVRHRVCSLSGDVKEIKLYRNEHGGVDAEVEIFSFRSMVKFLTDGQKEYRHRLMKRLAHASAQPQTINV